MHTLSDYFTLPPDVQRALDIPGKSIGYRGVSMSQFSIARHYGCITVNGHTFVYFPQTDELIRDDVLRAIADHKRKEAALDRMAEDARQLGLEL